MKIKSMDEVLKAIFSIPKADTPKHKRKAIKATRCKIRSADKLVNYATGNAIIDWLSKHPEETPVKYRPFNLKITYKTARDLFIDEIKSNAQARKLTFRALTPSDYGCDTILAMRDKVDIIANTTFVDRINGRLGKADLIVKSNQLSKFLSMSYTDTRASSYGKNWHYVPVYFCENDQGRIQAELNITITLDIMLKYQECSPAIGIICTGKSFSTYRPVNYEVINNGITWLDSLDSTDEVDAPGANAQIRNGSPWTAAVKYYSLTQEHMSMISDSNIESELEWKSIEEYHGKETEWVNNYYSDTGNNMDIFRDQFIEPVKLLSADTLDGKVFQATVLDTGTGETTYYFAETLAQMDEFNLQFKAWTWGPCTLAQNSNDMFKFVMDNDIKFPFTCSYDLDFICVRALDEKSQEQIPVINFNLTDVAREYYTGTGADKSTKMQLMKLMKQASSRIPAIMHQLIKMSQK